MPVGGAPSSSWGTGSPVCAPQTGTRCWRPTAASVRARWVVNAAGLGADVVDRLFGHDRFTVTPRRGELLVFDKLARPMVPLIVLPVPSKVGKGVLVSPTIYGNVMLGPTAEDLTDKGATGTSEAGFEFLLGKGHRLMPELLDEEVTASYAGLRAATEHADYLIDVDASQHYALVGGIRSTGLTAGMAIAEHVRGAARRGGLRPRRPRRPARHRHGCRTSARPRLGRTRTPTGSPPTRPTAPWSASASG